VLLLRAFVDLIDSGCPAMPAGKSVIGVSDMNKILLLGAAAMLALVSCSGAGDSDKSADAAPPAPPPAPVAAPAPATADAASADAMIVTARKSAESTYSSPATVTRPEPTPPRPDEPTPQRAVQSGTLTAADHDDILNADLYATYASKFLQNSAGVKMPYIDTRNMKQVRVVGQGNEPVPFAKITVRRKDRSDLVLKTVANGSVALFPSFDGVADDATVEVQLPGQSAPLRQKLDAAKNNILEFVTSEKASPAKAFDLMLVIDTTGSMTDELAYLQAELKSIVAGVAEANPGISIRVGLIVYRDQGDSYVVRDFPFTKNITELQEKLMAQSAGGGGDYEEAVQEAMAKAVAQDWRDDAVKALMLVADAPPHDADIDSSWKSALIARDKQIHIVPVAASGVAEKAEFLMRSMSVVTASRYLFLTDDSGVGNKHAEPDVDCYVVTRLDQLVGRVLNGLISGRRIEPKSGDILRTVGDYDAGICRMPDQRQQ
jgi:Mg-chelatase subunit ChlD